MCTSSPSLSDDIISSLSFPHITICLKKLPVGAPPYCLPAKMPSFRDPIAVYTPAKMPSFRDSLPVYIPATPLLSPYAVPSPSSLSLSLRDIKSDWSWASSLSSRDEDWIVLQHIENMYLSPDSKIPLACRYSEKCDDVGIF